MVSSVIIRKDTKSIGFLKIEVNPVDGSMVMYNANYELNEELMGHVNKKHRVKLPCNIHENNVITLYVPNFWDEQVIENYVQAVVDEYYMLNHQLEGCKTKEQIEASFVLEVILL